MNNPKPPDSIMDKIRRVLALSENGATEGERTAAKNALDRLLAKWGVDLDSLITDVKKWHEFSYKSDYEYRLLIQLAPREGDTVMTSKRPRSRTKVSFKLTDAEYVDLSERFAFYRVHLKEALDLAYMAFLSVNGLLAPANPDSGKQPDLTPDDIERYKRIRGMSRQMIPAQYNLKLASGTPDKLSKGR